MFKPNGQPKSAQEQALIKNVLSYHPKVIARTNSVMKLRGHDHTKKTIWLRQRINLNFKAEFKFGCRKADDLFHGCKFVKHDDGTLWLHVELIAEQKDMYKGELYDDRTIASKSVVSRSSRISRNVSNPRRLSGLSRDDVSMDDIAEENENEIRMEEENEEEPYEEENEEEQYEEAAEEEWVDQNLDGNGMGVAKAVASSNSDDEGGVIARRTRSSSRVSGVGSPPKLFNSPRNRNFMTRAADFTARATLQSLAKAAGLGTSYDGSPPRTSELKRKPLVQDSMQALIEYKGSKEEEDPSL